MSFMAELGARVPVDSLQRPYVWTRKVKLFESNSIATLETAINNWMVAEAAARAYLGIIDIISLGANGNTARALVSYGYFDPQP